MTDRQGIHMDLIGREDLRQSIEAAKAHFVWLLARNEGDAGVAQKNFWKLQGCQEFLDVFFSLALDPASLKTQPTSGLKY